MDAILAPSELGSSLLSLTMVLGLSIALPQIVDRECTWQRSILFAISAVLALRYLWWRATVTIAPFGAGWDMLASWSFLAIEAAALASSLSAFLILSRTRNRSVEATANAHWWEPGPAPRVAVLIATYNESAEVLERTILGAKGLDHPNVEVLVIDDARREWLTPFCARFGVRHVTRPDNSHAKAGNINHALALLRTEGRQPDFIAVLDADFVPHHDFLARTLPLFRDASVGLVQTPQHFFNADPIQNNLGISAAYPDEQRFFFDQLQPARDAWGIAFCCGTSSVVRWQALEAIGGLPTSSVTEDFLLTLTLQEAGWRTAYLNEPLSEGLAPEGLKEYVTQRARWCLGLMQIARGPMGPFARNGLRLRDRWSVVDSVLYWTTTFVFRLAALIYPLFYWFFDLTVVNASVPDVISYFGVYYLWVLMAMNLVSRGQVMPMVVDVSQLLGAWPIFRAAFTGLVRPHGHPFRVTAKGGDRSRTVVQWAMMRPFAVLFALTALALVIGILSDHFAYNDAGDGKAVVLFWTIYNLIVLALTMLVCIELPRVETHVADRPEQAMVIAGSEISPIWIAELTSESARIRGIRLEAGTRIALALDRVGKVPATVERSVGDGMLVTLNPAEAERDALLRRLYADGNAPGPTRTRGTAFLMQFAARLMG